MRQPLAALLLERNKRAEPHFDEVGTLEQPNKTACAAHQVAATADSNTLVEFDFIAVKLAN